MVLLFSLLAANPSNISMVKMMIKFDMPYIESTDGR